MAKMRPITVTGHIQAPTFKKVLAACQKPKSYATVSVRNDATVRCRTEVKGNVASIDFELFDLGTNFSKEAQGRFIAKHQPYLASKIKKFKGAKSPFMGSFGKTLIRFHVLEADAEEWFNEVFSALQDPANFTAIESPYDHMRRVDTAIQSVEVGEKQKVSDETIRKFYPVIRDVGLGKLPRPDGIDQLNKAHGVNRLYARSFIDMFLKMLRGEQYKRQLTVFTTELFLEKIGPDFGGKPFGRQFWPSNYISITGHRRVFGQS